MEVEVANIPESRYRLIPVPSQMMESGPITSILCKGQKYSVVDRITYHKGETIPAGFMMIVLGKVWTMEEIWDYYPKSESLVIFVTEKIEETAMPSLG